jgi:hypothetical protein
LFSFKKTSRFSEDHSEQKLFVKSLLFCGVSRKRFKRTENSDQGFCSNGKEKDPHAFPPPGSDPGPVRFFPVTSGKDPEKFQKNL